MRPYMANAAIQKESKPACSSTECSHELDAAARKGLFELSPGTAWRLLWANERIQITAVELCMQEHPARPESTDAPPAGPCRPALMRQSSRTAMFPPGCSVFQAKGAFNDVQARIDNA